MEFEAGSFLKLVRHQEALNESIAWDQTQVTSLDVVVRSCPQTRSLVLAAPGSSQESHFEGSRDQSDPSDP